MHTHTLRTHHATHTHIHTHAKTAKIYTKKNLFYTPLCEKKSFSYAHTYTYIDI